jgi:predicted nucleotide-binding protein (sugar kinase/HSP70/actin superfamily)
LEKDRGKIGMVLFGRAYNAFVEEANLGIPKKFASQGILLIPHDFLPSDHLPSYDRMYWYSGQQILRTARLVKNHPQLFGTFITNFSCGPDSFILSYFRKIMGSKPSLTLELDSHSADVGIDTRIDAALDIIKNYLEMRPAEPLSSFVPEKDNQIHALRSKEIEVVIPSMGRFGSEALAAVFNSIGINAKSLPVPTTKTLGYGRNCTNCKECLPFILSAGSMLEYLKEGKTNNKKTLFFMPTGGGPCRQGQYITRLKDIIDELEIKDAAILTLMDENAYGGMGVKFLIRAWIAVVISDLMQDMEHTLRALALEKNASLIKLEQAWKDLLQILRQGSIFKIFAQLRKMAKGLSAIELRQPLNQAKLVSLVGEVFVRREEFSRMDLINKLSERGFVVRSAPVAEYIYYCNYLINKNSKALRVSWKDRIKTPMINALQVILEKKIKQILSESGLITIELVDIKKTIERARLLISEDLLGEGILTVGCALREIKHAACGIISIGPFACMPSRLAEAILSSEMAHLPFLSIETDGNPFPQIIQSKIEIFMLRAERFHHFQA